MSKKSQTTIFTEKLPDKKIVIKKFGFSCDDIDETIPKPLPQSLNWFMLLCGRPGSGKTTLLLNLICKKGKNYNKKYDRIFIFSPSLGTLKTDPFEDLPEDQKFQELDVEILEAVLEDIKDTGEKILLIMDDVVNDIKKSAKLQTLLCKILMNRRHLAGNGGSVSVIMTTQVYNKIPAPIRKTASQIFIYHTKNKKELETIFDELILIPKKEYYELLKYTFQKKNDFLYIDVNKDFNRMFHRNFNELEFGKPDLSYETIMDSQGALLGSSSGGGAAD
jgi:predicted ATPase